MQLESQRAASKETNRPTPHYRYSSVLQRERRGGCRGV